jgi:hypothetical protein
MVLNKEEMAEVQKFIRDRFNAGHTEESIRKELEEYEISQEEVDFAFNQVAVESSSETKTQLISGRIPFDLYQSILNSGYTKNEVVNKALKHYVRRHLIKI